MYSWRYITKKEKTNKQTQCDLAKSEKKEINRITEIWSEGKYYPDDLKTEIRERELKA